MDIDIKEEVYKCSKCGLCQSVCPIYLATKNEMYLPRGRYIILNNFFNNQKKLSKKFLKNLDVCLNCNLCKDFCPSNIDMEQIIEKLKNRYCKTIIPFSFYYKFLLYFYRFFNFKKVYKPKNLGLKGNVLYFEGCYNKYINPIDKNASLKLIEELGYKITKIIPNCCGYPLLSDGNLSEFEKNAEKIISECNGNFDYIVCSCDSCFSNLLKIKNEDFTSKLITLDKLLELNNYKLSTEKKVYFYKPLLRKNEVYSPFEFEKINKKGTCSLMENFFMLKHRNLAKQIRNSVFNSVEQMKEKDIITTCNLTKWGLSKQLKRKVFSYSEYVFFKEIKKL